MSITNICLALFLMLQAADVATTTYAIKNGLREGNPVMRFLIGRLGLVVGQAVIKLPVIVMISYFALTGGLEEWAMIALVVPFAAVLVNNLYWLHKARI